MTQGARTMDKDQIIFVLLMTMAIVLTIELMFLLLKKKRRKEEMRMLRKPSEPTEPLSDRAHNSIITTESISATLANQGIDTGEADALIRQARKELAMKDYVSAAERAEAAKLVLLRAKREHQSRKDGGTPQYADPGTRPMDRSIYELKEQPVREERSLDSLPANYVQAKFMLATAKDILEKRGITSGEAYNFYSDAVSHFKREDYTKALSLSIKAERLLDSGTLTLIAEEKLGEPEKEGKAEIYPYHLRDDFLSAAEHSFYLVLRQAVEDWAVICPKVSLSDVFTAKSSDYGEYRTYTNKIDRKHIDFLLCEPGTLRPVAGIELDDRSHARSDRQARDEFVKHRQASA
ncbi:MAG: DUF2726 domain-containing protein, partial [Thermoplasmata archaeon]